MPILISLIFTTLGKKIDSKLNLKATVTYYTPSKTVDQFDCQNYLSLQKHFLLCLLICIVNFCLGEFAKMCYTLVIFFSFIGHVTPIQLRMKITHYAHFQRFTLI